jgi:hypothetical protein
MHPAGLANRDRRPEFRRALPPCAGIGWRAPHYRQLLAERPNIGWLEVHSENFFCDGGQALYLLEQVRLNYPVSLHGVGLSLGSVEAPSAWHLDRLERLIRRVEPAAVSEHLCWGALDGRHLNDLLPLPYTEEALSTVCENIQRVQDRIGRALLVENISSYLRFTHSTIPEWQFVAEVARRTGCDILLDVNNIHVSATNHGFDPHEYLYGIDFQTVREIHLAGFDTDGAVLIDTHGTPVAEPVWSLYEAALERFGPQPTLIEWDTDIPALETLLAEAERAQSRIEACHALAA